MTWQHEIAEHVWQRPVLVLDGAIGTELERHGVPTPAPLWSAAALDSTPGLVRDLHAAYARSGADIIVANTFRLSARAVDSVGRADDGPTLARRAVKLAREGVAHSGRSAETIVAASVGPARDCYTPEDVPGREVLQEEHDWTLDWLLAADPDMLWIETIGTVREAAVLAELATARAFPFVLSFILDEAGALLGGEPLAEAVAAVDPHEPLAFGLNCMPPQGITRHLPGLVSLTKRRVAAYAHINDPRPLPGWSFAECDVAPEKLAQTAADLRKLGASIIGGCCGSRPEHIAAIAGTLQQ
jgi:S-methylmethionine-dependent homocysteine/selenocysteine methylase